MSHKCKVTAFLCKLIKQVIRPHLEGQICNAFSNIIETKMKCKWSNAGSINETHPLQFGERESLRSKSKRTNPFRLQQRQCNTCATEQFLKQLLKMWDKLFLRMWDKLILYGLQMQGGHIRILIAILRNSCCLVSLMPTFWGFHCKRSSYHPN